LRKIEIFDIGACCNLAAIFRQTVAVRKNRVLTLGALGAAALAAAGIGYVRSIDVDRFRPALIDELRARRDGTSRSTTLRWRVAGVAFHHARCR
jgi:O-antigen ligase